MTGEVNRDGSVVKTQLIFPFVPGVQTCKTAMQQNDRSTATALANMYLRIIQFNVGGFGREVFRFQFGNGNIPVVGGQDEDYQQAHTGEQRIPGPP